jgi:hypothetical protein
MQRTSRQHNILCFFKGIIEDPMNNVSARAETRRNILGTTMNVFPVLVMDNVMMRTEGSDGLTAPSERQVLAVWQYRGNRG